MIFLQKNAIAIDYRIAQWLKKLKSSIFCTLFQTEKKFSETGFTKLFQTQCHPVLQQILPTIFQYYTFSLQPEQIVHAEFIQHVL